jgi:hypothetical protein
MGKRNNEIQLNYVWQKLALLAFNPSGNIEVFSWISCFARSLQVFWEVNNPVDQDKFKLNIYNDNIPLGFGFCFNDLKKFVVKFYYPHIDDDNLLWIHDVDKEYYSPYSNLQTFKNKDLNPIEESEIIKVLDGFLFHPAVHQHIVNPSFELVEPSFQHLIRIGGGIHNPFHFLFHLRYQFCLIPEKREEEKKRLLELFSNALAKRRSVIPPSELMGL